MEVLFDTSFLVALFEKGHPEHRSTRDTYRDLQERKAEIYVATHTLAELYAVLTALPVKPRITAQQARRIIEENVIKQFNVIDLTASMYRQVIEDLATSYQTGGIVYDALIAEAATSKGIDRLYTLNKSDFERVWNKDPNKIREP